MHGILAGQQLNVRGMVLDGFFRVSIFRRHEAMLERGISQFNGRGLSEAVIHKTPSRALREFTERIELLGIVSMQTALEFSENLPFPDIPRGFHPALAPTRRLLH